VLSSSKSDSKHEARFAARIDVLGERVDTLAAAVATTASAMAKKDGEIAGLHRELKARDEQIQALAARTQAPAGVDTIELRELKDAVAAVAAERTKHGSSKQLDELAAKVGLLGQRLETLSTTVSTTAAGLAGRDGELAVIRKRLEAPASAAVAAAPQADPGLRRQLDDLASTAAATRARLDGHSAELEALRSQAAEPHAPSDELRSMLATLRTRVESLDGLKAGVTQEALDHRLAKSDEAASALARRVDALAAGVESAAARLSDRELELAALHRHFTESSSRIETIVADLREALGAFSASDPDALAALQAQLESTSSDLASATSRIGRLEAERADDLVTELADRIDRVDKRVETVATEITRAKTLWPVALRSLEARLDSVNLPPRHSDAADLPLSANESPTDDEGGTDDLLAGLRDSLQAMENVAAEMERASDGQAGGDTPDKPMQHAAAGGAQIVPLRAGDP
jgi:chromosome segregation ATPase